MKLEYFTSLVSRVSESALMYFGITCADPEGGGQGVRIPPLKNHKNIGFSNNTCPDPLKIVATKPAFNVGP